MIKCRSAAEFSAEFHTLFSWNPSSSCQVYCQSASSVKETTDASKPHTLTRAPGNDLSDVGSRKSRGTSSSSETTIQEGPTTNPLRQPYQNHLRVPYSASSPNQSISITLLAPEKVVLLPSNDPLPSISILFSRMENLSLLSPIRSPHNILRSHRHKPQINSSSAKCTNPLQHNPIPPNNSPPRRFRHLHSQSTHKPGFRFCLLGDVRTKRD